MCTYESHDNVIRTRTYLLVSILQLIVIALETDVCVLQSVSCLHLLTSTRASSAATTNVEIGIGRSSGFPFTLGVTTCYTIFIAICHDIETRSKFRVIS